MTHAYKAVADIAADGGHNPFRRNKKQAQDAISRLRLSAAVSSM